MARWSVFPDGDEPAQAVTALAEQVERDGGRARTFRKLIENVEGFDVGKVRYEDIQRSAIMAAPPAG